MIPTAFDEENRVFDVPPELADLCTPLSVFTGLMLVEQTEERLPVIISCWKFTAEDLEQIKQTGRLWVVILGNRMPPIDLTAVCPFTPEGELKDG